MAIGDWFKHDIYCLQDDRLFTLVSRYGAEGYAVFFHTIEAMYANAGNPIYDMTVRRISFDLSLPYDKVLNILEFASSESCHHLFHLCNDGGYVSSRVAQEVSEQNEKRQRYSNMGKASAERRSNASSNASSNVGSTQVERKSNIGSTDKIREDKKRNKYRYVSKDTSLGEQSDCSPVEEAEKTDLFGQKIEDEREHVPVQKIVDYWNKSIKNTSLPQIRQPNESRKTLIKQRWLENKNDVYAAIDKTVASDFLTGRDGKWTRCSFDWVFKKENMVKILEGNYDNKKEVPRAAHKDYSDVDKSKLDTNGFNWGLK